jgi:SpoVK/Ycf46/Vps4 family AAA+-type ATPase
MTKKQVTKSGREKTIPLNASWHLRSELSRLLIDLQNFLHRQRERGRSPAADAVRGFVIEEGEAEGLIEQLASDWDQQTSITQDTLHHADSTNRIRLEIQQLAQTARHQGVFLPLLHAQHCFALTDVEYDAVLLALAAEVDSRFGRMYAYLNDHIGYTRPTLGLAMGLHQVASEIHKFNPPHYFERPFIRDGLVELEGDGPVPGKALKLNNEMAKRLMVDELIAPTQDHSTLHLVQMDLLQQLILSKPIHDRVSVWSSNIRKAADKAPLMILAGLEGSGRRTLAHAALSAAGLAMLDIDISEDGLESQLQAARRDIRWYNAALLINSVDENMPWRTLWSHVEQLHLPVIVSLTPDALETATQSINKPHIIIELLEPDRETRRQLWHTHLPSGSDIDTDSLDALAANFKFNAGRIQEVLRRAKSKLITQPANQRRITKTVLYEAAREIGAAAMGDLAQKLPCPYQPEDLVVPQQLQEELYLALAWVQQQNKVLTTWGFEHKITNSQGLSALFSGPPGTGKTMASQILARQLGLDIYRVDLSQVMSKYIGETEKNLSCLFDEAHRSGAILFFDEGDALFGKRSEVNDAHDRYANVEIGYLLQRMEEHDGIVILATNRKQDMDEAFVRRFDAMIDFPMPNEKERYRIWQGLFPPEAEVDSDIKFDALAKNFELSGGEIRNTVLAAAYLAANENSAIGMPHIKKALKRELIKNGRVVDVSELEVLDD